MEAELERGADLLKVDIDPIAGEVRKFVDPDAEPIRLEGESVFVHFI